MKTAYIFAALVALFWGCYGPTLSKARAPMGGDVSWGAFKPYVFIGVAYLVIAIFGGAILMKVVGGKAGPDSYDYSGPYWPAAKWGFLAGCLGALGALALTYAVVKTRGNPAAVMPIVFGGAVTVNALVAFFSLSKGEGVNPLMWVGMALVAVGIVLTAKHTPHGSHPPAKPAAEATTAIDAMEPGETVVVQREDLEDSVGS